LPSFLGPFNFIIKSRSTVKTKQRNKKQAGQINEVNYYRQKVGQPGKELFTTAGSNF